MITDELFGLKMETLRYFDRKTQNTNQGTIRTLIKLAITECLYSGRIITLLGGERHSKQVINVSALIRLMPPESLGVFREFYTANRDLNILMAEKHFGSKRGKSHSAAMNKQLDRLFAEIVNTNDSVLNRLKKQVPPSPV